MGLVRKVSDIFLQPTFQAAPPTCPLHVWRDGRGQAQSNRIQGYAVHFRKKKHHRLLHGNWNALPLKRKELELVEEAKKYHLGIVEVSSTKKRGSGIVDLGGGWKLFYSGADPIILAPACVRIFKSPQLSDCVLDWLPLRSRACMLKLKVKN